MMSDVIPGILGGLGSVAGVLMGVGSGSNERNLEAMRGNLEAQLGFSALQRQREYINLEPLPKPLADVLTYGQWGVGEPKDQYVWIHDRSQFAWIHNRSTYHKN